MGSYGGTVREDRAKALAGVVAVHVVLGAIILTGLNVHDVRRVVESLKTFDIVEEPLPPPQPPPPQPHANRAKDEEGAAGKKAEPSPVVVPKPRVEVRAKPPIAAAPVAGTGSASTSGAANYGTGPGAGGSGSGRGGGGSGGVGIGQEARLLGGHRARLPSELLRQVGLGRGSVPLRLTIGPSGRVTSCQPLATSGSAQVDAELCRIMISHSRWSPATDTQGNRISVGLTYTATYSP